MSSRRSLPASLLISALALSGTAALSACTVYGGERYGAAGFAGSPPRLAANEPALGNRSVGPPPASARRPEPPTTAPAFVREAAISDMYEIQAGQLAQSKAASTGLRDFGAMMVTDHAMTSSQLRQIVTGLSPAPQPPMMLDGRRQAMLDELRAASGGDFDQRYAAQQIAAHEEALFVMRTYAERGESPALKGFVAMTAPKIQMHLAMINQLARMPQGVSSR